MDTKSRLVQCVGFLVLVVALMGPVAVQAAPVQGDEIGSGTQGVPVDWFSSWSQVWNSLRAAFGMATEPEPQQPPETAPQVPLDPGLTVNTLDSTSQVSVEDKIGTIDPVG